jgi:hypothetical protein
VNPVFVAGYPQDIGGANTLLWHTVKLWRAKGLDVTMLPMGQGTEAWRERLDAIGCRTIDCSLEDVPTVSELTGGTLVAFCNARVARHAALFREPPLCMKIVWDGCMNFTIPSEEKHCRYGGGFERYVFQSRYQYNQVVPGLAKWGVTPDRCHLVHAAFDWDEFPYQPRPHKPGETFVIGKLCRAHPHKFSADTWDQFRVIRQAVDGPVEFHVMGFSDIITHTTGPPPSWVEAYPAGLHTSQDFLAGCHCLVQSGDIAENWPRVGLEAMSAGVPVLADDRGGWPEMIAHGETGYLCKTAGEYAACAARLAADESWRLTMTQRARRHMEDNLAAPDVSWADWQKVFEGLL